MGTSWKLLFAGDILGSFKSHLFGIPTFLSLVLFFLSATSDRIIGSVWTTAILRRPFWKVVIGVIVGILFLYWGIRLAVKAF